MNISFHFVIAGVITVIVGCESGRDSVDATSFARLKKNDEQLPIPQPGDWLFVHEEKGQTFEQYINYDPVRTSERKKVIYILPLGNFSAIENKLIDDTRDYLQLFFFLETKKLPTIDDSFVPAEGRRDLGDGHVQLLTSAILNHLQSKIPEDGIVIMAITNEDLYPGADWNFVFGQARTKHRVAVSSIYRYLDGALDSTSYEKCLERIIKTSSHEIGHMFSIQHCTSAICLMNGVNNLPEADSRPNRLCSECLKKLQWNLNFNIKTRNDSLEQYFTDHHMQREKELFEKDREAIKPVIQ